MAISPKNRYNANQIDTSDPTNYPEGKAKNISALGNTDGSPFEQDMLNDIWGFQQAILKAAGNVVPDGNPENANASQYLAALRLSMQGAHYYYREAGAGSLVVPEWVTPSHTIRIIGSAGGGGGGSCMYQSPTSAYAEAAAGGGGGSGRTFETIISGSELVAGSTINFNIGDGGVGGAGAVFNTPGLNGGDGGTTTLDITSLSLSLAAAGGSGGGAGYAALNSQSTQSGAGGYGLCGGGGGASRWGSPTVYNGSGGGFYAYDSTLRGLEGQDGWKDPYVQEGLGGNGGVYSIVVSPGVRLVRDVRTYFGNQDQQSLGGKWDSWIYNPSGTPKTVYTAGGGGGAPGGSPIYYPPNSTYDSKNGYNLSTSSYAAAWMGKGGGGPGAGGGGAGIWDANSISIKLDGGRGATGMIAIIIA